MSDTIALVATIVAFVAMCVSIWQAREALKARKASEEQVRMARRSLAETETQSAAAVESATSAMLSVEAAERAASAAEEQAIEARKAVRVAQAANDFALEKDQREQSERDAATVAEAGKIRLTAANMGGFSIKITNYGSETVYDLEIESVNAVAYPTLTWRHNPRTSGGRKKWPTLERGQSRIFYVDFTDEDGTPHRSAGNEYAITFGFTDVNGQRWRRNNDATPERVDQHDTLAANQHDEAQASPTSRDMRFQLLRYLADRIQESASLDIAALPSELGLGDSLVQQNLQQLYEGGLIRALPGDDRILSVHELTAAGHSALEESGW